MHFSRQLNCWLLRCSWSIACRRCSNYIFVHTLTPGFNGLGKDSFKMRREAFKFWDLVRLILETLRYILITLTSSSLDSWDLPDQNKCEQTATPRHWSGFLSSFAAASAHLVRRGSWFSSVKHFIRSNVPMMRVMAANWALLSLISSSYREKA